MPPTSTPNRLLAALVLALAAATLSGCYVYGPPPGPIVACPPGMHPGPYGHRCFYN